MNRFSRLFLVSAILALAAILPTSTFAATPGVSSPDDVYSALIHLHLDALDQALRFEVPELHEPAEGIDANSGQVGMDEVTHPTATSPLGQLQDDDATTTLHRRSTSSPPVTHAVDWLNLAWVDLDSRRPALASGSGNEHHISLVVTYTSNPVLDDGLIIGGHLIDDGRSPAMLVRRTDHASEVLAASSIACAACHAPSSSTPSSSDFNEPLARRTDHDCSPASPRRSSSARRVYLL